MTETPITLIHDDGRTAAATVKYSEPDDSYTLHLIFADSTFSAHGSDYFDSFCKIRRKLEGRGWLPLCDGARRNVYPSGMCRDMGRGLVAYVLTLGSSNCGTVRVFDSRPGIEPSTVDDQRAFFEEWLEGRGI